MSEKRTDNRSIVYSDGSRGEFGDFPVAVSYLQTYSSPGSTDVVGDYLVVDPIFNSAIEKNLYGRIMTLVEATTDSYKLKAVKDLFSKELKEWSSDIYESARDIATSDQGGDVYRTVNNNNIYLR